MLIDKIVVSLWWALAAVYLFLCIDSGTWTHAGAAWATFLVGVYLRRIRILEGTWYQ